MYKLFLERDINDPPAKGTFNEFFNFFMLDRLLPLSCPLEDAESLKFWVCRPCLLSSLCIFRSVFLQAALFADYHFHSLAIL